jgi:serine/threonine protein kinase
MLLGPYQLLDRIGVGGMAEVWRASQKGAAGFERPIAIKRILNHLSADPDFVAMFVDEAKIAVQLSHPNIVQTLDLGHSNDEWYIAMELVHGKDLRAVIDGEANRGQRIPLEVALHVVTKVCDALHHAHFGPDNSLRIVHRDVSPQNVLISFDGEVKVTDFGLAKAAGRIAQTQAGTVKGKLAYMSPEQLRGKTLDQRSDVFAAGILLWELLAGERLFLGRNDRETIEKAYKALIPSLRQMDPTIPEELERITMKALATSLEQRYATAMDFHDDLEAFVYGSSSILGAASLSAYMRALFPSAEEASSARRRDPRAATAEIDLPQAEGEVEELDDELLESESMPPPAPSFREEGFREESRSSLPPADASLVDDEIEDFDAEPERSKTEPPGAMADAWDEGTVTFDSGFGSEEPTPEFSAGMARAVAAPEPTLDDPDATAALDDDALYAAALANRPPPEDLVTRLHGPNEADLARSRQRDHEATPNQVGLPEAVPTNVVVGQTARPAARTQKSVAKPESRQFEGFDDDDQTTTAGGGGRRT